MTTTRTCTIDGCDKPTRTSSADLCSMHYHRWYRHGSTDRHADRVHAGQGRRYRSQYRPGHPLAMANGKVYEHRAVLYDAIGPGTHRCHWCQNPVDWKAEDATRALQVDHLNAIGDDNRPENLVPSCPACNTARGSQAKHEVLVEAGFWSNHDTIARTGQGRRPRIGA